SSLLRIGNGRRLGQLGGVDGGNDLADRFAAQRAVREGFPICRTAQLEMATTDGAPSFNRLVFVNGHRRKSLLGCSDCESQPGPDYQLDFVTPGIIPAEASSRKVRREILKRRRYARRRPEISHRFTTRTGLASLGRSDKPT